MLVLKLVVMLVIRHLVLKKTIEQSYTSLHFHLHEPPSFSCPPARAKKRRWFLDYGMASSKRLNSGLSTSSPVPTSRWPRLSANVGETRATSDRWTRETGPPLLLLLILLLLSASPSHGTREDPLERDRRRHSYTFGSLKVDDPRRHCFFFTLLRSRSDARKRDSE